MRSLALLVVLALPASAQQVLLHESFENGLAGWTATGLWNAESATDSCGASQAPFPDGTGVAYYGIDGACDFDTFQTHSGSLSWNDWLDLPTGSGSLTLRFWSRNYTEHCWNGGHIHRVFVTTRGGAQTPLQFCDGSLHVFDEPWHERRFDLTPWAGQRISIQFAFDSGDSGKNYLLGWTLDGITIEAEPGIRICPGNGIVSGCPCTTPPPPPPPAVQATAVAGGCRNSTQQSAVLVTSGLPSVAADTLRIAARDMPPNASCILVQNTASAPSVVFGDGIRCVVCSKSCKRGLWSFPPSSSATASAAWAVRCSGWAHWPPRTAPRRGRRRVRIRSRCAGSCRPAEHSATTTSSTATRCRTARRRSST